MKICKESPADCTQNGLCCVFCNQKNDCLVACSCEDSGQCALMEDAVETDQQTALRQFQSSALVIMKKIRDLDLQKKALEEEDKKVREQLQEAMDRFSIKNFENDILKITYVAPTTRETIDSKALKADLPAIAEKYTKVSQVKGSVRIVVK